MPNSEPAGSGIYGKTTWTQPSSPLWHELQNNSVRGVCVRVMDFNDQLIRVGKACDDRGFFRAKLPPGRYHVYTGQGCHAMVEVQPERWAEVQPYCPSIR